MYSKLSCSKVLVATNTNVQINLNLDFRFKRYSNLKLEYEMKKTWEVGWMVHATLPQKHAWGTPKLIDGKVMQTKEISMHACKSPTK